MTGGLEGWLFALGLIVLGLASAAQAALVYIDRARLRHLLDEGQPRARALAEVIDAPNSSLATILLIYTMALVLAAGAATYLVLAWWPVSPGMAVGFGAGAFILVLLAQFFGRLVAVSRPERVALAFVNPLELLRRLFSPILLPLMALESWAGNALGLRRTTTPAEMEERLRHMVEDTTELEEDEREMIAGVIELGEQPVREAMVPRIDMQALPTTASVRDVLDRIVDTGHSRIPIYDETVDNITGLVYAKDLLKHLREGGLDDPVAPLAREPYYVPETKKVDDLLHEMQQRHIHLAIVVDEYGGTAGLITIEDLIEEIVGEIQDEYDVEEAPIQMVGDDEAIFDARVSIRDVNDALDIDLDDHDFDTIGGLLYHQLGRVPLVGEEVQVDGARVSVLTALGRRVKKVRVQRLHKGEPAEVEPTAT